jgi:hypothetical protein
MYLRSSLHRYVSGLFCSRDDLRFISPTAPITQSPSHRLTVSSLTAASSVPVETWKCPDPQVILVTHVR